MNFCFILFGVFCIYLLLVSFVGFFGKARKNIKLGRYGDGKDLGGVGEWESIIKILNIY